MTDIEVPDTVEREMVLRAPLARVWAALTEPMEIVKWFGDGAELDLRPGGSGLFSFGTERCPLIVHEVDPMHLYSYWWEPGPGGDPVNVPDDNRTLVRF